MSWIPPVVSRWYRFDWQYATDISRIPVLSEAALIISITPIVLSLSRSFFPRLAGLDTIPIPLWLFWGASVAFVFAVALLYLACPRFIREYRDFGQYAARQHSHRWILWEFYNNIESLSGWENIVRETSAKLLSTDIESVPPALIEKFGQEFAAASRVARVFTPVNIDRDLYLPMHIDGKKFVLAMREQDTELPQKEKELFWILYSQAAKERPIFRAIYWILIGIAVLLLATNIARKVYLVIRDFI